MERIFSLTGPPRVRRDYTPLLDGEWWNVDFGDFPDDPGVAWRVNLRASYALHSGRMGALRSWAKRRGLQAQQHEVPTLDAGPHRLKARLMVRLRTQEQVWADHLDKMAKKNTVM